ncbi:MULTISPECIES: flavodoxin [Pseudofrankia]|uniref:flavodoxin n=1 Tax=Pseudofrankia TaxID=2994363 RepID=UPI000234B0F3|nr:MULTISPECIES: flavodoxin [Pseudofrankia]OHV32246.1 hypothetical protein BCD49_30175 [Pseudofrankia sp. EUN1h]
MTSTLHRRHLLRAAALGGIATVGLGPTSCSRDDPQSTTSTSASTSSAARPALTPSEATGRVLLAYFSRAGENYYYGGRRTLTVGNTEKLATMIAANIDCDVYRIEAADPYSDSYDQTVARNVQEQRSDARPAIARPLPDVTGYDTILLGSPIWNVRPPRIMLTFLANLDLQTKALIPFTTCAMSGLGLTAQEYTAAAPHARLGTGLAVQGEKVDNAGGDVERWVTNTLRTR